MNKATPVAVAGAGVISAIGNDVRECLSALESGHAGMDDIAWLDTIYRRKIPVAEVKASNARLEEIAGVDQDTEGPGGGVTTPVSRTSLLSLIAAREALDN